MTSPPFPQDYKIAVTGGTGLVGSYLIRMLLKKGYTQIRAMKRSTSPMGLLAGVEDQVEWVEGDLLDTQKLYGLTEGVDVVFHCGAYVSFSPAARQKIYSTNVHATADLVNASLKNGVKRFIYCSSIAALGRDKLEGKVNEDTDWKDSNNLSDYGRSKYFGEMEVWRGHAEGLSVSIINPSIILGGGFWYKGSSRLFKQIDRGLPFCPAGTTGFVDVRDVVEMMILMGGDQHQGKRYISSAENKSYREVLKSIGKHLGKPAPSIELKKWMIHLLPMGLKFMKLFGLKLPKVTKPMLMASLEKVEFDNSKFLERTDFEYRPIEPLIEELCQLYKSSGGKGYVLLSIEE